MRLMKLSKACFGPRHRRLSTFCPHGQHRRRTPLVLRIAAVPRRSSYSTSAATATNPVPRHATMAAVHKWLTNTAPSVRRALSQKSKAGWVGSIGAHYPSKRQATLARIKRPTMIKAPETMPRNVARGTAWASLAPNQEPPLRLAARTMPRPSRACRRLYSRQQSPLEAERSGSIRHWRARRAT